MYSNLGVKADPILVEHLGLIEYQKAWDYQREIQAGVIDCTLSNTLLLLEHPSVYTAGRRTETHERPIDGTPVIDVDRGGKITWHGEGQLVGYPIIKLSNRNDVVGFVREIENALIAACSEFSVNINPDMSAYDRISPCGFTDTGVTSLANELGRDIKVSEVLPVVERHILLALDRISE